MRSGLLASSPQYVGPHSWEGGREGGADRSVEGIATTLRISSPSYESAHQADLGADKNVRHGGIGHPLRGIFTV